MEKPTTNGQVLTNEYAWFAKVLQARFESYFAGEAEANTIYEITPPDLTASHTPYANFIEAMQKELSNAAHRDENPSYIMIAHRLVVLLALAPEVKPDVLDLFFTKNTLFDRPFTEFGGTTGKNHRGFLPTGETALFLLAGNDLEHRLNLMDIFQGNSYFYRNSVLHLNHQEGKETTLSGSLSLTPEYLSRLISRTVFEPRYGSQLPVPKLTTSLHWNDLILADDLKDELSNIIEWVKHEEDVLRDWKMGHLLKPGYRALFYGSSGTGKTLSAALIGQETERPVYSVDLSRFASNYIGETEKNLGRLFDVAEKNNWILFFDEADALFGKRSSVLSANDRYANQAVSYLLQRIENHPGLVILATNLKENMDDAFSRRFQSMLYFATPDQQQRQQLWKNAFPESVPQDDSVDLSKVAFDYELTGGSIINVARYAISAAIRRKVKKVSQRDILKGIKRELQKQEKPLS